MELLLTCSDESTHRFSFDSAAVLREAISTIDALHSGARAAAAASGAGGGGGSAASVRQQQRSLRQAPVAAALYGDLKPRDTTLLLNEFDWSMLFESSESFDAASGEVVLNEGEQYRRVWQVSDGTVDVRVGGNVVANMPSG